MDFTDYNIEEGDKFNALPLDDTGYFSIELENGDRYGFEKFRMLEQLVKHFKLVEDTTKINN